MPVRDDDEVVGRAGDQRQLGELVPDAPLGGDVVQRPDRTSGRDLGNRELHPRQLAPGAPHAHDRPQFRRRDPVGAQGRGDRVPVLFDHEVLQQPPEARVGLVSQGATPGTVEEDQPPVGIGLEHHLREQLDAPADPTLSLD